MSFNVPSTGSGSGVMSGTRDTACGFSFYSDLFRNRGVDAWMDKLGRDNQSVGLYKSVPLEISGQHPVDSTNRDGVHNWEDI